MNTPRFVLLVSLLASAAWLVTGCSSGGGGSPSTGSQADGGTAPGDVSGIGGADAPTFPDVGNKLGDAASHDTTPTPPDAGPIDGAAPDTQAPDTASPDVPNEPPDASQADTGTADAGGDAAVDAATDVAPPPPLDGGPTDTASPDATDGGAPKPRAFLVDDLQVEAPTLSYDITGDGVPDELNGILNALLVAQLHDATDPIRVLGVFDPFAMPGTTVLRLGTATCSTDGAGEVNACTLDSAPAVFDDVTLADSGTCPSDPPTDAPCFSTPKASNVPFDWFDISWTFEQAWAAGGFDTPGPAPSAISQGHVWGFVSAAQAKAVAVDLTGDGNLVTLFDLVSSNPVETLPDGTQGWTFSLQFAAKTVALQSP